MSDIIFPTWTTDATPASNDKILFSDTSDSWNIKDSDISALPISTATQTALDTKVDENWAITGATKTKITYDSKGLVTAWTDATTADIADSTNKRYVTDANLTTIWNQSWTNTGDNATNTQYSWLATSKQDTLVSWTNIKTINSTSILWSGDIVISGTGHIIEDEGTPLTNRANLNFTGAGVTVTDNGVDTTIVTITSGGGSGDVVWPASATDNAIARFDSTTGKLIQNSAATIADTTGDITAGKYNTVAISWSATPTLAVTGTTAVSWTNTGDQTNISGNAATVTTNANLTWPITSVWNATSIASQTWTGSTFVMNTSPTLVTPTLWVASATSEAITWTAWAWFITLVWQSANPTSPSAGTLLLHSSTANGFTRLEQDNEATTNLIFGRDNAFIAKNTSGGTITKGSAVYVTGSTGNVPNISKAQANSSTTMATIAIVVDDIANNAFGQIMYAGILSWIDTSAFTTWDRLYVSPTVAGWLTNVRPSWTTNFVQRVATTLNSSVWSWSIQILIAPAVLNMETGTNAATWTWSAIVGTTLTTSWNVELWHASDTTLSRVSAWVVAIEWVNIVTTSSTNTLTNKRITPRVSSETSSATPTINTDNVDAHSITALSAAITSMTTNLSWTPTNFQKLIVRIKDDGTARAIAWGASFEAKWVALPTTTVISKVLTVWFIYDTVTSKWGCVASAQEV